MVVINIVALIFNKKKTFIRNNFTMLNERQLSIASLTCFLSRDALMSWGFSRDSGWVGDMSWGFLGSPSRFYKRYLFGAQRETTPTNSPVAASYLIRFWHTGVVSAVARAFVILPDEIHPLLHRLIWPERWNFPQPGIYSWIGWQQGPKILSSVLSRVSSSLLYSHLLSDCLIALWSLWSRLTPRLSTATENSEKTQENNERW